MPFPVLFELWSPVCLELKKKDGHKMSHFTRTPVLRVCDQVSLKPACSADETCS